MAAQFGDRLLILRNEHNLTIEEFIEQMKRKYPDFNLNKSTISRYERNIHKPLRFTLVKEIAEFYGVTVDYLVGKSDDKYGENVKYKEIPILGTIAAGAPILAQEDIKGFEFLHPCEEIDFCLEVKGDSMIGARIFNNDIVFVKKQDVVENGEIAVVQIDNEEATLKRFYKQNSRIILHAENPTIPDLIFTAKDRSLLKILGKIIYVKFKVKWGEINGEH